jgi:hypothetical protein
MKALENLHWEVNLRVADLMRSRSFRLALMGLITIRPLVRLLVRSH